MISGTRKLVETHLKIGGRMKGNCLICLLRPVLLITGVCNVFANYNCQHSRKPSDKPYMKASLKKRCVGMILEFSAIFANIFELFFLISVNMFADGVNIIQIMENILRLVLLVNLASRNRKWRDGIKEYKAMINISEYIKRFNEDPNIYKTDFRIVFFVILLQLIFYHGTPIVGYLIMQESLAYLDVFLLINTQVVSFLVGSIYQRTWIDITVYGLFFSKICKQVETEVLLRLSQPKDISWLFGNDTKLFPKKTKFHQKLQKLKHLYMLTLKSFKRSEDSLRDSVAIMLVLCFVSLIFLISTFIIWMNGEVELHFSYRLVILRYIACFVTILCFAYRCDQIQLPVDSTLTFLLRTPLHKLNEDESKEVELFAKMLAWEQPMKNSKGITAIGIQTVSKMMGSIIINSMVVTQLYYFINNTQK